MFITQKERKKIQNRMKKDNTLINIEEIKRKYELTNKIKKSINEIDCKINDDEIDCKINDDEIDCKINDDESEDDKDFDDKNYYQLSEKEKIQLLNTNYDFSNVNDEYIEKYSKYK